MSLSGNRPFSNNHDITFNDYLSNKKGTEIIKQLKSNINLSKVKFLSYNDFNVLTKAYSKNSNMVKTNIQSNTSINDKTKGLIYYEKIVSHIKGCDYCKNNNKNIPSLLLCNQIKNIISAYENNFTNTLSNTFQNKMNLDKWCKNCDNSLQLPHIDDVQYYNNEYFASEFESELESEFEYELESELTSDAKKYNINKISGHKNKKIISFHEECSENNANKQICQSGIKDKRADNKNNYPEYQNDCNCPQVDIIKSSSGRKPIFCSNCNKFIDICNCSRRLGRVEAINRVNHKNIEDSLLSYKNKKQLFI